jgi:DNA-binding ferritin-like protein (Dps family)
MNLKRLKEALRPWMQHETWNTEHPSDYKRFHKSLHNAFSELGPVIGGANFEEVMSELADQYYPDWDQKYKDKLVNDFAIRAEHIAFYLQDIKKI